MNCDPSELMQQARCFKCIPNGMQPEVQTYLLCQIANGMPQPGYDDLVFPPTSLGFAGGTNPAIQVGDSGPSNDQAALRVTAPNANNFWITAQMSHFWIAGTRIYPHIHVQPQSDVAASVSTFTMRYTIADINGTFQSSTVLPNLQFTIPANSAYKHFLFDLPEPGLDMSAFAGPSTVVRMKFTMNSITSLVSLDVLSFDIHYMRAISPLIPFVP